VSLVLVISARDLRSELSGTVLGRSGIEWLAAPDLEQGLLAAHARPAELVIVAVGAPDAAAPCVERLRADGRTREARIVVLLESALPPDAERLRAAGANAVLGGQPDPFLWDTTLDSLIRVPSRRVIRLPVRFWIWFRLGDDPPVYGRVLNLSTAGMLLESPRPLDLGTRLDAQLELSDGREDFTLLGEVVREAGGEDGAWRYGVAFKSLADEPRRRLDAFVNAAKPS
jgi:CheY-like chemotaxis protein